jgi:hypothetical protein
MTGLAVPFGCPPSLQSARDLAGCPVAVGAENAIAALMHGRPASLTA